MFKLINSKKSMFFSVIAILMITMILIMVTIQTSGEKGKSKIESTQVRIKALNEFMKDLERKYFQSMVDAAAHKTAEALVNYTQKQITTNPAAKLHDSNVETLNKNFELVFFFGYIKAQIQEGVTWRDTICKDYARWVNQSCAYQGSYKKIDEILERDFMKGYAFFDMLNKTENVFKNLGLEITKFDVEIKNLKMADPWTIQGLITLSYSFEDRDGIASWKGVSELPFTVSIIGLKDPITGQEIKPKEQGGLWVVDKGGSEDTTEYYLHDLGSGNYVCNVEKSGAMEFCKDEASSFFGKLMNDPSFNSKRDAPLGLNLGICLESDNCHKQ